MLFRSMPLFDVRGKREEEKPLSGSPRGGERLGLRDGDGDGRGMMEDGRCMISAKYKKKADKILDFVMMAGNFGHNRDMSYQSKYPYVIRKFFSMRMRIIDLIRHSRIFPLDSLKFFPKIISDGVSSAIKGY